MNVSIDPGTFILDRYFHPSIPNKTLVCGFPPFCDASAVDKCANITIQECSECSMAGAAAFGTVTVLLGLMILFSNGFVVFCTVMKHPGFTGHYSVIKASLACADLLTCMYI